MNEKLLTIQDLAERWAVHENTIRNWLSEGVLQKCKKIPAVRFSPQYIAEMEGVQLEKFSPLERRKLEREIEVLKNENDQLQMVIAEITSKLISIHPLLKKEDKQ